MAKRNSTKTATKEALQASEPKIQTVKGWKGMYVKDAAINWDPSQVETNQSDLAPTYLMVQNNVKITAAGTLETRRKENQLASAPTGFTFTGVSRLCDEILFCAFKPDNSNIEVIKWCNVSANTPTFTDIASTSHPANVTSVHWNSIYFAGVGGDRTCIALATVLFSGSEEYEYYIYSGDAGNVQVAPTTLALVAAHELQRPSTSSTLEATIIDNRDESLKYNYVLQTSATAPTDWSTKYNVDYYQKSGSKYVLNTDSNYVANKFYHQESATIVSTLYFSYAYTNNFGNTSVQLSDATEIQTTLSLVEFNASYYIRLNGQVASTETKNWNGSTCLVDGVDIYFTSDNYTYPTFACHAVVNGDGSWSIDYYGGSVDTSEWSSHSTSLPDYNTTAGPKAKYCTAIDGRLYFYGNDKSPERLLIGGNAPNELCVARGYGGAYVDINPGTSVEIKAVHKFKTQSGASIVTILCSNKNSGNTKRFNLIETNVTVSSSLSEASYMVEEVSNVVGCSSFYGSGVWADGMYYLDRYGVMVTTQQMEYASQLRSVSVSDAIEPIFTDRIAERLDNARMIYIDNKIYFILGEDATIPEGSTESAELDNIIFVYDITAKAWWTYSYEEKDSGGNYIKPLHLFSMDYRGDQEGLGLITPNKIVIMPLTGTLDSTIESGMRSIHIETGEISTSTPAVGSSHLCQAEFDFDYFVGTATFVIQGVDYYGRHLTFTKTVTEDNVQNAYQVWMRIDAIFRTYNITITGKCFFRMTAILLKQYIKSKKVNLVYGFDDGASYLNRSGATKYVHHTLASYNNLREVILP